MSGSAVIHIDGLELPPEVTVKIDELIARLEGAVERFEGVANPVSWSEAEAAAELDMSEISLSRERLAGRIAFSQVKRKPRYTREHLEEYLKSNTKQGSLHAEMPSLRNRKNQRPSEVAPSKGPKN